MLQMWEAKEHGATWQPEKKGLETEGGMIDYEDRWKLLKKNRKVYKCS